MSDVLGQENLLRQFRYNEPGGQGHSDVEVTLTAQEILDTYYSYWVTQMRKAGKKDLISYENCIEDFCVVYGAWEVKD